MTVHVVSGSLLCAVVFNYLQTYKIKERLQDWVVKEDGKVAEVAVLIIQRWAALACVRRCTGLC